MFTLGKHVQTSLIFCALASISVVSVAQQTNLLNITPGVAQLPSTGVGTTVGPLNAVGIQNLGQAAVAIKNITVKGVNASDFVISNNTCPLAPASLQPGAICYPGLSFTPSAAGTRVARLAVAVAGGPTQSAVLVGGGLAAVKALSLSPAEVTFPATALGLPVQLAPSASVFATNTGTVPLTIQSVALSSYQNFSISANTCSGVLQPSQGCIATVQFEPVSIGRHSANLIVFDDAPGGRQSISLTGIGTTATKTLQVFPPDLDFANVPVANPQQLQVILQNTGSESFAITGETITGQNAADYSIVSNTCGPSPFTLAAGAQCSLQIQFTPAALGVRLANLRIVDAASGSPQTIPLAGSGVAAVTRMTFTTPLVDIGLVTDGSVGYGSPALGNTGDTTLIAPSFSLQGGSADFQIVSECPDLPPNNACFPLVSFTPSRPGVQIATLVATEEGTGQSVSATLVGSGESPDAPLGITTPSFYSEIVGVTGPVVSVTLTNNSSSPVTLDSISIAGPAQADFGIIQNGCPDGTVLNAFTQCSIQLTFTPSSVGSRIANLSLSYSGGASALHLPLTGTGLRSTRTISFVPASVDLAAEPVGTSVAASATIVNTGNDAVTISRVALQGANAADWAITGNTCPVPPTTLPSGQDCFITLQFTPSAAGPRVALLQVNDNATGSPQNMHLTGFGSTSLVPSLAINPLALNFSVATVGSSSQGQLTLVNLGGYSITLSNPTISGANAADFKVTSDCSSSLAASSACEMYVTFTPSVTGLRVAQLQITDGPNGTVATIPLAGFGVVATASIAITQSPTVFPQAVALGYTASAVISIFNSGTENVTLSKFRITGGAKQDFGIQSNSCPLSPTPLTPEQGCAVYITFAPTVTGIRIATLQVTDSSPGSPQTISLVGEGVAPVKIVQITPATLSFGLTPVGGFAIGDVGVFNSGTAPVTFSNFSISGTNATDFVITGGACVFTPVVQPGDTCFVGLSFAPTATGVRTASLQITSDAQNSPATVALTGTGQ
jgi:hypothetical protein